MAAVDKKGKGKAVNPPAAETARKEPEAPRRRAVPGGEVIQFFNEPDKAPQRGYNQAKFEEAYQHVVNDLGRQVLERKEADRTKKTADVERLTGPEQAKAIERIVAEMEVPRAKAEAVLLRNDLKLKEALMDLMSPAAALVTPIAARGQ